MTEISAIIDSDHYILLNDSLGMTTRKLNEDGFVRLSPIIEFTLIISDVGV